MLPHTVDYISLIVVCISPSPLPYNCSPNLLSHNTAIYTTKTKTLSALGRFLRRPRATHPLNCRGAHDIHGADALAMF